LDTAKGRTELDGDVFAVKRIEGFPKRLLRSVVIDSDVQGIARIYL